MRMAGSGQGRARTKDPGRKSRPRRPDMPFCPRRGGLVGQGGGPGEEQGMDPGAVGLGLGQKGVLRADRGKAGGGVKEKLGAKTEARLQGVGNSGAGVIALRIVEDGVAGLDMGADVHHPQIGQHGTKAGHGQSNAAHVHPAQQKDAPFSRHRFGRAGRRGGWRKAHGCASGR